MNKNLSREGNFPAQSLCLCVNNRYADLIGFDDIVKDIFAVLDDGVSKCGVLAKQFIVCILEIGGRHVDVRVKDHIFLPAVKGTAG